MGELWYGVQNIKRITKGMGKDNETQRAINELGVGVSGIKADVRVAEQVSADDYVDEVIGRERCS